MGELYDIAIEYLDDPDNDCPYIRTPFLPRTGEFIKTPSGDVFRVEHVIHDDTLAGEPVNIVLQVRRTAK